jgi:RNA-directed DNA polymerase
VVTLTSGAPGGNRNNNGDNNNIGNNRNWLSSYENDTNNAWNRNLSYFNASAGRFNGMEQNGFSVSCLRDLPRLGSVAVKGKG